MAGLSTGGWLVLFGKTGQVRGEIVYHAPKGKTEHLIADLAPGAAYSVTDIDGKIQRIKSSSEGSLRFKSNGSGTIRIVPAE